MPLPLERRAPDASLRESEVRFRFLDRLSQATRSATDPVEIMGQTAQLLGEHMRASRCAYADVDADNDAFTIRSDWSTAGVASSAGVYSLDRFGPQAATGLRDGRTLVVSDVDAELGPEGGAAMFSAIGIKALICSPLAKDGRLIAMMAVHQSTPRRWTAQEVLLVEEVVERCWAHIERVRDSLALREQDRRKDEFLATLAHELRNPLAPIRYAVASLKAGPGQVAQAADAFAVIDRQVATMARLIDGLLDLSRVSRGLLEIAHEPVAIAAVIAAAVETSRPLIEAAGHALQVTCADETILVEGDATRLAQVLGNLLNNAVKYTPPGGRIALRARGEGGHAIVEVEDDGIGIPAADQRHVFQMFVRSRRSASLEQGGLGIGLALARQLVEMHGGAIEVSSAGAGRGSRFTVTLPLAGSAGAGPPGTGAADPAPALAPLSGAAPKRTSATPAPRPRVLVVEDNRDGLASLISLLELWGYRARGVADGPAALAAARSFRPEIVLLDIGLPGLDGYEVAAALRADSDLGTTRLVALTGWGSPADRQRARDAGFDRHCTKPVDPEQLLQLLEELSA